MATSKNNRTADPVWERIRAEAAENARREPMLASFLHSVILNHHTLEDALSFILAGKLESHTLTATTLRDLVEEAFESDPAIGEAFRADIKAVCERDPAVTEYATPVLYLKGFLSLQAYRVAHYFWQRDRKSLALFLQSHISEVFDVDIHPAARVGKGIFIDHATSVVIGETAIVEDNVSMLHEVTLGGTGKTSGDRHPKIRKGVLIAAGAKILGNVEVGKGAKVGASAVVLEDVPPHTTVVGVPAKPVGGLLHGQPALEMDHRIWINAEERARQGA
ncbi:MAG: serine O-acetyltransferase [Candidatus Hydrogenedentota bacterium]